MTLRSTVISGDGLQDLLAHATTEGLSAEDLSDPGRLLFAYADDAGNVVGYGGLELFGGDALLRSVVVKPAYRRAGHGRAIVEDLIARATRIGAQEIWLLTSTAPAFFTVMGFSCTPRDAASPAIAASREFSSLCPSSAVLMRWRVGPANEA